MVNAKKPAFFTHRLRHIREYRPEKKTLSWRQPEKLVPGKIYSRVSQNPETIVQGGSVTSFVSLGIFSIVPDERIHATLCPKLIGISPK